MWIWKDDPWTKAVDDIELAIKKLRSGKQDVMRLKWGFLFMETPPSNRFTCDIRLVKEIKDSDDVNSSSEV